MPAKSSGPMSAETVVALVLLLVATAAYGAYVVAFFADELPVLFGPL